MWIWNVFYVLFVLFLFCNSKVYVTCGRLAFLYIKGRSLYFSNKKSQVISSFRTVLSIFKHDVSVVSGSYDTFIIYKVLLLPLNLKPFLGDIWKFVFIETNFFQMSKYGKDKYFSFFPVAIENFLLFPFLSFFVSFLFFLFSILKVSTLWVWPLLLSQGYLESNEGDPELIVFIPWVLTFYGNKLFSEPSDLLQFYCYLGSFILTFTFCCVFCFMCALIPGCLICHYKEIYAIFEQSTKNVIIQLQIICFQCLDMTFNLFKFFL